MRLVHSPTMTARYVVGFDATQFERPMTGVGQYALRLWQELACCRDERFDFRLLAPGGPSQRLSGNAAKLQWEQFGLPKAARQRGVDLVHVPYFSAPRSQHVPYVVTVHDVIPLALPAYANSRQMRAYLSVVARTVRQARMILTDSEFSRTDIVRRLGIPADRVRVSLLGVGEEFSPVVSYADEMELDALRTRLRLHRPFVLNVGGFDLRKRLDYLIRGFALAQAQLDIDYDLVLVGNPHSDNTELYPSVEPLVRELGLADSVRLVGFVSEEDKLALYRAAEVFAFTSEYEGFGLNPLEALACGAPVICSNRTSLPEVVGDAALLIEPEPEAIAAALVRVLGSPDLRADLALRGPHRARAFTWRRTAEQTLAVYREIAGFGAASALCAS